jgi:hypothetical protein
MNHPITPLAAAEINHDHLKVELVEPDSMPTVVRIIWPDAPTVVDPKTFPRCRRGHRPTVCSGAHCARCNPGGATTLIANRSKAPPVGGHIFAPGGISVR